MTLSLMTLSITAHRKTALDTLKPSRKTLIIMIKVFWIDHIYSLFLVS